MLICSDLSLCLSCAKSFIFLGFNVTGMPKSSAQKAINLQLLDASLL